MVTQNNVWHRILKSCAWLLISKCYVWLASGGRQMQCFETLCLVGVWRVSDAMFWDHTSDTTFQNQASKSKSKSSAGCNFLILKCCVWWATDAMFWNHTSDATFQNQALDAKFQNVPHHAIFCDHASDMYHEWHSVYINTFYITYYMALWSLQKN